MSSPSSRSGSRRSRSRSRSRVPARRRYSRSRSQSGSEGESYGGSSQTDRRDYSRSSARKDHSRKRRRSRSEDLDNTPHRQISNALVPVNHTRHAEEVIRHTWDLWQEIRWLGSGCIYTHYPGSGNKPPEEALQNDFQVCQERVAEHAGDAFADNLWDIVLHAIVRKLNTSNRNGGSFLPT